jgi:prolipoprotein diacylglyceryltransferase
VHFPLEFHVGTAVIPAHLLFEMLAYTAGYRLYVWQRARGSDLISDEHRWWIFIGAAAGALLGSHALGTMENPQVLSRINWLAWMGNKTIVGGLLGGLAGVETTKKVIGIRVSSGDLMTYPLILGMAVGRLGCHFAGLADGTHGCPSDLPWAIDFGDGIPRHPVNLYEITFLTLLAACLLGLEKIKRAKPDREHSLPSLPDGARFKIFMITYLIWRFFVEWLKPVWFSTFGLSVIQMACIAGLFYYRKSIFQPKTPIRTGEYH